MADIADPAGQPVAMGMVRGNSFSEVVRLKAVFCVEVEGPWVLSYPER